MIQQWQEYQGISDTIEELGTFGLTTNEISKLHQYYKNETVDILKNNPYKITEVSMIGFKKQI